MKIAVVGCAHGEIENIYNVIEFIEKENNLNIELLLCCGDFQATRNLQDLKSMAAPPKFRSLCTFYKYYSGEKVAPKLTIIIGGNHEASNYLQELPYGGWVAPNIYYLGYAGVVNFAGIRIAGISGIFKGNDFAKGRYERPPYNEESLRSCYHIRNLDIFRLKQLSTPINIMLSHDWPGGITNHGNVCELLSKKPFFKEDVESDNLGSKPTGELLEIMKPNYWFSAHLHVKFSALVEHTNGENKKTKFLALDKCLPRRKFLQILDISCDNESNKKLYYDLEWLTILHLTNHLLSVKKLNCYMPGSNSSERWKFTPTEEEKDFIMKKFHNNLVIPKNFAQTALPYNTIDSSNQHDLGEPIINPQTVEFCKKLSVDDPIVLLQKESGINVNASVNLSNLECSTFIGVNDSETEVSLSPIKQKSFSRTPLKLPLPSFESEVKKEDDFLTSTPLNKLENKNVINVSPEHKSVEEIEEGKETKETASVDTELCSAKKFRRRNISIYASKDDE